ncbi:hypothetical protein HDU85_002552, partial [Gaertneriomyces sp. JEL0708]
DIDTNEVNRPAPWTQPAHSQQAATAPVQVDALSVWLSTKLDANHGQIEMLEGHKSVEAGLVPIFSTQYNTPMIGQLTMPAGLIVGAVYRIEVQLFPVPQHGASQLHPSDHNRIDMDFKPSATFTRVDADLLLHEQQSWSEQARYLRPFSINGKFVTSPHCIQFGAKSFITTQRAGNHANNIELPSMLQVVNMYHAAGTRVAQWAAIFKGTRKMEKDDSVASPSRSRSSSRSPKRSRSDVDGDAVGESEPVVQVEGGKGGKSAKKPRKSQ